MKLYQMLGYVITACYLADILLAMPSGKSRDATATSNIDTYPENDGSTSTPDDNLENQDGNQAYLINPDVSHPKLLLRGMSEMLLGGGQATPVRRPRKMTKRSVNRSRGKSIRMSKTRRMRGRVLYGRLGISPEMTGVVFG